jgi:hypothetical protein
MAQGVVVQGAKLRGGPSLINTREDCSRPPARESRS